MRVRTPFIHLLPPLSVSAAPLYCISDALAWLLHSVVRYRRKVVDANLRSSFPDKTDAEIRLITRRFYRFLSDYFVETVKLTTMGRRQMSRRMRFEGLEEADKAWRPDVT